MIHGTPAVFLAFLAALARLYCPSDDDDDLFSGGDVEHDVQLDKVRATDDVCAICLDHPDGAVRRPRCGHAFCVACFDAWVARAPRCPLCNLWVKQERRAPPHYTAELLL